MSLVFILILLLPYSSIAPAQEDLHSEVAWALDWNLPENKCEKPNLISQSYKVTDSEGDRPVSDVDSYTIRRYERKEKRWKKCVDNYKKDLMKDFTRLKDSAQYGLTQEQANSILEKLSLLQKAYLSPDGLPETAPDPETATD